MLLLLLLWFDEEVEDLVGVGNFDEAKNLKKEMREERGQSDRDTSVITDLYLLNVTAHCARAAAAVATHDGAAAADALVAALAGMLVSLQLLLLLLP